MRITNYVCPSYFLVSEVLLLVISDCKYTLDIVYLRKVNLLYRWDNLAENHLLRKLQRIVIGEFHLKLFQNSVSDEMLIKLTFAVE